MKGLIQRVTSASVTGRLTSQADEAKQIKENTFDGKVVSSIGQGLCVLVGIHRDDAPKHADWLAKKILSLRLFDGENDKRWDKSVKDKQYEVLCVSQFTLDWILKGNKPDFHLSMSPEDSEPFYNNFIQMMETQYSKDKIKNGIFGAMMQVDIQNDGPVTLMLETPDNLPDPKPRKPQHVSKKTQSKVNSESQSSPSGEGSQKNNASNDTDSSNQQTVDNSGDTVKDMANLTV